MTYMTIAIVLCSSTILYQLQGAVCIRHPSHSQLVEPPCPAGYFPCNSSDVCVEQRMNCDKKADCPDQSDEWACEDHSRRRYYDQLFKKRPDADREQNMLGCELRATPEECECSKRSLFCNHRDLRKIPLLLPQNIEELDLSGNELHILQKSDFPILQQLETLILTSSEVTLLKPEAMGNLVNLKKLYLTSNRISVITNATFWSNTNLKLLQQHYHKRGGSVTRPITLHQVSQFPEVGWFHGRPNLSRATGSEEGYLGTQFPEDFCLCHWSVAEEMNI